jgi:hypothetical protein
MQLNPLAFRVNETRPMAADVRHAHRSKTGVATERQLASKHPAADSDIADISGNGGQRSPIEFSDRRRTIPVAGES